MNQHINISRRGVKPSNNSSNFNQNKSLNTSKNTDLFVTVSDLFALFLALTGLFSWYGAWSNNPMAGKHTFIGANLIMNMPASAFVIALVVLIAVFGVLRYQKIFHTYWCDGILEVVSAFLLGIALSKHWYGTTIIASVLFSSVIAIMVLSVETTSQKDKILPIHYLYALLSGLVMFLLLMWIFKFSFINLIASTVINILLLGMLYLAKNNIEKIESIATKKHLTKAALSTLAILPVLAIKGLRK